MNSLLTLVIAGAVSGGIYSLIGSGLVLTYSATGIFNLSYGAVAFVAAFLYFELRVGLGWPVWLAAGSVILLGAPLLGTVLDSLVFRPLAKVNDSAKTMATVGLLVALPAMAKFIVETGVSSFSWGVPDGRSVLLPPGIGPSPKHNYRLPGGATIDSNQIIVLCAAVMLGAGLHVLMSRSRLGLDMRAVVDRDDLAALRGIDQRRTSRTAWVIGTTMAATAGVVGAPILNSLDPGTYTSALFVSCAAAVLGRFRSVPLAFVGGISLGIVQNLVAGYLPDAFAHIQGIRNAVPFAVLLVGLILLGRDRSRVAGVAASAVPPVDHADDLSVSRRRCSWIGLISIGLVYVMFINDGFWNSIVLKGLIVGFIFLSFTVITGLGGMVSLAQAAFATVAGMTAGLAIGRYDLPFLLALVLGAAVAMGLGVLVALPSLRLGGTALALATLALAFLASEVLFKWNYLRNGSTGWRIGRPAIGPIDLADDRTFVICTVLAIALVIWMLSNLERSTTGRAILAVRNAPAAASAIGISPQTAKLRLVAISAAVAGIGGVLLAGYNGSINEAATPAGVGLLWLAQVVLWGVRRPSGAVIAGLFAVVFPQVLSSGWDISPITAWLMVGATLVLGALAGRARMWTQATILGVAAVLLVAAFARAGFDGLSWAGTRSIWVPQVLFGLGAIQLSRYPDGLQDLIAAANRRRRATPSAKAPVSAVAIEPLFAPSGSAGSVAVALDAVDLHVRYGTLEVVHGINLQLRAGSITALIGSNGAGKTTICLALAGLLQPSSGRVVVAGAQRDEPAHVRSRHGVLLAPESRGVFPSLSIDDNLCVVLADPADREVVYERFPILRERRHLAANNLSGGEQQILALAPLLVRRPGVLIVDEPTLGLAPRIVDDVLELIEELRDSGVAVLVVEEKPRRVLGIADRVSVLRTGHITWTGTARECDDDVLTAAYLGESRAGERSAVPPEVGS